jgi:hypothetical protein
MALNLTGFLPSLICCSAVPLVGKPNYWFGRPLPLGHDEADARKQFAPGVESPLVTFSSVKVLGRNASPSEDEDIDRCVLLKL